MRAAGRRKWEKLTRLKSSLTLFGREAADGCSKMNQSFANSESSFEASHDKLSEAQKRYLERGLSQPGGKLPLFDSDGQAIPAQTVKSCIARGWCEPWFANPMKPEWLVCRLTVSGYHILGADLPPPVKK